MINDGFTRLFFTDTYCVYGPCKLVMQEKNKGSVESYCVIYWDHWGPGTLHVNEK